MYKGLKKTKQGQISVEAAIIVPIILIVIASLIYMAFYAHDIVSIRSGAYSLMMENTGNREWMPSSFVIKPKVIKTETTNQRKVNLSMSSKGNVNFINKIIQQKNNESLTVQKTMSPEILYAVRALLDTKKEGEN